ILIKVQTTSPSVQPGQNTNPAASPVKATGMKLSVSVKNVKNLPVKSKYQLAPKKTMQISVALLPANAKAQKIIYKSSKPSVAKVNAGGKITAGKKAGKTVITVTSASGLKKKFTVQVMKKAVKKITLKASKKKIKVKKKLKLKATVKPGKKQASSTLYWKSSNPKVATVNQKGVVKAKKKGKVKITVYATDGSGRKKAVKLTV
ncbi:MAG: Ig-like domain-containing protein, partial [Eubacteriales bacterium]|nr:Ig-like domain-containing protein [Eubacteriales bacterium]